MFYWTIALLIFFLRKFGLVSFTQHHYNKHLRKTPLFFVCVKNSNLTMKQFLVALAFLVNTAAGVSSAIPPPEIFVDPLLDSEWQKDSSIVDTRETDFIANEFVERGPKEKLGAFVADEEEQQLEPFSTQIAADDFVAIEGGIQMETSKGSDTVGWMEKGDWVAYSVTLPTAGTYEVEMNIASPIGDGAFELVNMNTKEVYGRVDKLPVTGDYEKWKKVSIDVELPAGEFNLQLRSTEFGWNIQWISLKIIIHLKPNPPASWKEDSVPTKSPRKGKSSKSKKSPNGSPAKSPKEKDAKPTPAPVAPPTKAPVKAPKPNRPPATPAPSSAPSKSPVKAPAKPAKPNPSPVKATSAPTDSPVKVPVKETKPNPPPVKPQMNPSPVKKPTSAPSDSPVKAPIRETKPNPPPVRPQVNPSPVKKPTSAPVKAPVKEVKPNPSPTKPTTAPTALKEDQIELFSVTFDADDYSLKEGVELDVQMMRAGDWVAYPVQLPTRGRYTIKMRISSPKGQGAFEMINYETQETLTTYKDLPATGNWRTWRTVTQFVDLPRGSFDLQILALEPGWSLLWLKIEEMPTFIESETDPTGFVRAFEQIIVDPEGFAIQLKGMSLGGWMVQEPNLMLAAEVASSPSEYHQKLKDLVGETNHTKFKQSWLDNFVVQEDIKEMKSIGFNLVRVPMHYELFTLSLQDEPISGLTSWVGTGFKLLDDLLSWCAEEEMYVMLDLQAAPGGQSRDMSITDYNASRPSLFESPDNQYKALVLWQALAYRYSENPWIAGYELLSAVDWTFSNDTNATCLDEENTELKTFYVQAIDAIRAVDQNHMIVINGNCGGNHHSGLWPMADENLVLGFQDEGEANFTDQLLRFTNYSDSYGVPLLFKPGAYDDAWNAEAVAVLEQAEVSWSWWTWKMMESSASAFSISTTDSYEALVDYLGVAPSSSTGIFAEVLNLTASKRITYKTDDAIPALMSIANNTKLAKCTRNPFFLGSLLGGGGSGCDAAAPIYVDPTQPSRIQSGDYCMLKQVGTTSGVEGGWLNNGDSVSYKVHIGSTGTYEFLFKVSSMDGSGGLQILSNGIFLTRIDTLPLTTRRDEWSYVYANVPSTQGTQQIEIVSTAAGWTMDWFQILFIEP